jgi:hypothetical protein
MSAPGNQESALNRAKKRQKQQKNRHLLSVSNGRLKR